MRRKEWTVSENECGKQYYLTLQSYALLDFMIGVHMREPGHTARPVTCQTVNDRKCLKTLYYKTKFLCKIMGVSRIAPEGSPDLCWDNPEVCTLQYFYIYHV